MFARRVIKTRQDNWSLYDAVAAHPVGANLIATLSGASDAGDELRRCGALAAALYKRREEDERGRSIVKDDDADVHDDPSIGKDGDVDDLMVSYLKAVANASVDVDLLHSLAWHDGLDAAMAVAFACVVVVIYADGDNGGTVTSMRVTKVMAGKTDPHLVVSPNNTSCYDVVYFIGSTEGYSSQRGHMLRLHHFRCQSCRRIQSRPRRGAMKL